MSDLKYLRVVNTGGVARITFARPKHNVLDIEMMNELNGELTKLVEDDTLKCVVFLGEGPSWCAGVEVADHKPEMVDEMISVFSRIFEWISKLDVPTIAGVHGACLGGGMEVAIACDIVLAAKSAVFSQPEIKLGFFPPYAAVRLPELIGPAKAIEVCTTGRRYFAEEAKSMGFVSQTTENDNFEVDLEKLIKEIRVCSPLIIRLNKRAVRNHVGLGSTGAMGSVNDYFLNTLMKTEDTLEGIKSFEEKRRPAWKNK